MYKIIQRINTLENVYHYFFIDENKVDIFETELEIYSRRNKNSYYKFIVLEKTYDTIEKDILVSFYNNNQNTIGEFGPKFSYLDQAIDLFI